VTRAPAKGAPLARGSAVRVSVPEPRSVVGVGSVHRSVLRAANAAPDLCEARFPRRLLHPGAGWRDTMRPHPPCQFKCLPSAAAS